jgi:hypothetical protein
MPPVAISVQNQLVRATRNVRQRLRSAVEAKEWGVPKFTL